ncbi:serine threonine- kinase Sgk2 protein [Rutstroemia sp. NJR-2017a BBW]|nr:serine threonine- kinase Sgk2 protein [Rutstroemia sp. NJR-2017a BBW]
MRLQNTILSGLGRRYYTSANKQDWSNVLVIGEHKQYPDEDRSTKTLVQLAGYTREVFGSQPGRRFVPGFTICRSMMRLWVFDRSGSYNSEKFDIYYNKQSKKRGKKVDDILF